MRYIRTKTGIYNLEEKDEKWQKRCQINDEFEEETYGGKTGRTLYIPQKAILNQADTIKELCDCFVVVFEDKHGIVYDDFEWAKTKANANIEAGIKVMVYGAIWTEWGLKYVAKMNKDGELV